MKLVLMSQTLDAFECDNQKGHWQGSQADLAKPDYMLSLARR